MLYAWKWNFLLKSSLRRSKALRKIKRNVDLTQCIYKRYLTKNAFSRISNDFSRRLVKWSRSTGHLIFFWKALTTFFLFIQYLILNSSAFALFPTLSRPLAFSFFLSFSLHLLHLKFFRDFACASLLKFSFLSRVNLFILLYAAARIYEFEHIMPKW